VDTQSNTYVQPSKRCEFFISSTDSPWGIVQNPRHSLPPNTTCRYDFQGAADETVWISFIKYYAASPEATTYDTGTECNSRLRVWDGRTPSRGVPVNISLLGDFCKEEIPRLCDHTLLANATRFTRPCSIQESYVSSGSALTLEQFLRQGSALFPFSFVIRYEFVDTTQEGAPDKSSDNPCDRVFVSSQSAKSGRFHSPRSVFFYGRGGAQNITCTLRFEANESERVRLTFTKAKFGDRSCVSRFHPKTERYFCDSSSVGVAQVWVSEYPWNGIQIPTDCYCSQINQPVVVRTLTASVVEVNFTVTLMNISQDFNDFYFEGEYQFLHVSERDSDGVELCPAKKETRRLVNPSGEIRLSMHRLTPAFSNIIVDSSAEDGTIEKQELSLFCVNLPWLIEPEDPANFFIYLKMPGYIIEGDAEECPTLNRVLVYPGSNTHRPFVVCPATTSNVELFSFGWNASDAKDALALLSPHSRSFVIEFMEREYSASHAVTWMEVSKRPPVASSSSFVMASVSVDCPHR